MSKGRLRAINNSIALKNKFGEGYRISVVTDKNETSSVKSIIEGYLPEAKLEDDSAGALIYKFPVTSINSIPKFVAWLESNKDKKVKGWGISQSNLLLIVGTLEEVFLKLIRDNK